MLLKWKNVNNVFELMFTFNVLELGIFNVFEGLARFATPNEKRPLS